LRWDEARDAARVIGFSYRFAQLQKNDGRLAGVTMGRYFVRETREIDDGTMKARWPLSAHEALGTGNCIGQYLAGWPTLPAPSKPAHGLR